MRFFTTLETAGVSLCVIIDSISSNWLAVNFHKEKKKSLPQREVTINVILTDLCLFPNLSFFENQALAFSLQYSGKNQP